jgi:hypothetical protein
MPLNVENVATFATAEMTEVSLLPGVDVVHRCDIPKRKGTYHGHNARPSEKANHN